jgi:hypothetical protein
MIPGTSLRDRSRLSRNPVVTGFKAAMAQFVPNRCHTPFARRASTVSPFLNAIVVRRYRHKTRRKPILTIIHAPHASPIIAMRYHITPSQALCRSGYTDCACATRNSNRCERISQKASFRADCNDYACATRNLKCCKGISPRDRSWIDDDDYACATRKPNDDQEMRSFCDVRVIPAPHVSWITVRRCAFLAISRPVKVCALLKRSTSRHGALCLVTCQVGGTRFGTMATNSLW